ncbi:MAG: hypothetical protein H7145_23780 [Akkermansiaceae bacterium]|nr:hypothetical protein [Armatimonadota bacterium]
MGSEQTSSRFASGVVARPAIEPPVEDFAMISLESVEKMLRDTGGGAEGKPPASDLPPPIFAPTAAAHPTPPPKPAQSDPAGTSRFRFADLLRPDGAVDTEAVYRFGKVPEVKLSAELILQALANLPPDIPELARHAAIQITVNSLTQAAGIPVETVAEDARVRHTRLTQFHEALTAEWERENQPQRQTIVKLEELIAAKQAELEAVRAQLHEREAKSIVTHRDCETKLSALQEVIDMMEAKTPEKSEAD